MQPPTTYHLPSGSAVLLAAMADVRPRHRQPRQPLFAEAVDLFESGDVRLERSGAPLSVMDIALGDFHALRAIVTHLGWLHEDPVDLVCRNCGRGTVHLPCRHFALGPFIDGELTDPDLDVALPFGEDHPIEEIALTAGPVAPTVRFSSLTLRQATPLHRALRRRLVRITHEFVRAMGIDALGTESDPRRIAQALRSCSESAWQTVAERFLATHYPPRLFSVALCPDCGARHDVDAPYDREFEPSGLPISRHRSDEASGGGLPEFGSFVRHAEALWTRVRGSADGEITFVVEEGPAACDEGGEPLLGSYDPPWEGDGYSPSQSAQIVIYYRTFRAMWEQDGPYDWRAELAETVEHELGHHCGALCGHDPVDDAEREVIEREPERILGQRELARRHVKAGVADFGRFVRLTWPLWLLVLAVTVALVLASGR